MKRTLEDCNFKFSSSYDPREITIFESDSGAPTKFLLKKKIKFYMLKNMVKWSRKNGNK